MSKNDFENSWALGSNEQECDTVTLTLEDDSELECLVLTTLDVEDKQYIALLPIEGESEEDEGTVYLYRMEVHGDGEDDIELISIEEEEEYEKAAAAFEEYLDTLEFDEVFGDDEE